MSIEYNAQGQLKTAALKQIDETVFWDKTRPTEIQPAADDVPYTIRIGDRLDLLAFDKLQDASRGWIILLRNNIRLWPNDFVPGVTIYIPTLASLSKQGIV